MPGGDQGRTRKGGGVDLVLDLQQATHAAGVPIEAIFRRWVKGVLGGRRARTELVIRIVGLEESRELNRVFRGRDQATNVLSFPFEAPRVVASDLLGDLVICAPLVEREAREQGKALAAHWAHLTVHGVLHLLGFDHQNEAEAADMESREVAILAELGFADPYAVSI